MKFSKLVAAAAIAAGTFAVSSAQAHAIWFAQRATQLSLIYGVGADDLDMLKRVPLLNNYAAYDAGYKPVPVKLRPAGPLVLVDVDGPSTVLTADMDYGYWSKTADGQWHKKGRDEVPAAVVSEHTRKYTVAIRGPLTAPIPVLPNQVLQIVPVGTALPDLLDKPMTVRVLYEGKPVAGAIVQNDYINDPDNPGMRTAADGTATIKVRNQGFNVLAATYNGPTDNAAKTDRVVHLATLSFTLPHAPE
ncbi:DUF4198 domain-containing protein [Variovorax paradoxus]|uniref:Nickel uptake substrate-specific transmembrane region n=1 Tax=Variovorax paradoxus TaxID=34073 RepID=A0A0H2M9T1_VARPD|nr:DUF4198 domain-containing protein [Variovorax paradoxus]KLN57407.1 nickel uptake substrate-specific transmembrane region [Variovorax paradoxus]